MSTPHNPPTKSKTDSTKKTSAKISTHSTQKLSTQKAQKVKKVKKLKSAKTSAKTPLASKSSANKISTKQAKQTRQTYTIPKLPKSKNLPKSTLNLRKDIKHKWNLSALFASKDELVPFSKQTKRLALDFEATYKGKLSELSPQDFGDVIARYEGLIERIERVLTFAFLVFAEDTTKGDFYAKYELESSEIYEHLVFFELEFCDIDSAKITKFIAQCEKYAFYLQNLLVKKSHKLDLSAEKALIATSSVGVSAFSRLFDEHLASLKIGADKKGEEEILSLLHSHKRKIRQQAQEDFTKSLQESTPLLSYILNMVRKDLSIQTRLRNYPNKESFRHISNQISQKSVDSMMKCVNANFHLVHSYYALKGSILGINLKDFDRYAPIFAESSPSKIAKSPQAKSQKESTKISYAQALNQVILSYENFSPSFAKITRRAIKEGWVSSHPTPNKRGGAFSHGATPKAHPFVLLNWTGNRRDAFTIAHEFGHMIHQELSKNVGTLNHDTPLTTAETASVFGEMLFFDYLKRELKNKNAQKELLQIYAGKLEDIFSTLFRQVVMTNFERAIHAKDGELKAQDFDKIWQDENEKMFGKSLKLTQNYARWWSYIPHFIHSPFYCYAYSYGQLLVLALFGLYKSGKCKDFVSIYTDFLSAGGSKSPSELVGAFGFDIESSAFWNIGINEVQKLLWEFCTLCKEQGIKIPKNAQYSLVNIRKKSTKTINPKSSTLGTKPKSTKKASKNPTNKTKKLPTKSKSSTKQN